MKTAFPYGKMGIAVIAAASVIFAGCGSSEPDVGENVGRGVKQALTGDIVQPATTIPPITQTPAEVLGLDDTELAVLAAFSAIAQCGSVRVNPVCVGSVVGEECTYLVSEGGYSGTWRSCRRTAGEAVFMEAGFSQGEIKKGLDSLGW